MRTKRQGIIIWFQHRRNIKQIRRYGHLIYTSKKLKYAVLYVDQDNVEAVEEKLMKLSFISKVERSHKPFISVDFDSIVPEKEKKYDYNMGI